jgi:hypothetical protein
VASNGICSYHITWESGNWFINWNWTHTRTSWSSHTPTYFIITAVWGFVHRPVFQKLQTMTFRKLDVPVHRWAGGPQSLDNPCQVKVTLRPTVSQSMFLLVWKLLSCPCEAPSLTRGRVCRLSVIVGSISSLSFVQLFTILLLKPNRMYSIYKVSVGPGSLQQPMSVELQLYKYIWDQALSKGDNRKICNINCVTAHTDLNLR